MRDGYRRTAAGATSNVAGHAGFRPDIQGLRAIAVLAVVLYHAHMPGLPGGFVGVDIFFVISGYLICGLLHRELATTGRIDLARFWMRRSRRLLPNACLTLLAVLFATAVLRPGYTFPEVAKGVAAAALYYANVYFAARDVDYFADDAHPSPVLHFWSLSVEEQFYIAWPLLLVLAVALFRRNAVRGAVWLIGAVWVLSFISSIIAVRFNQPLAFYHSEMRAWQLATGGLLAMFEPALASVPDRWRVVVGWLGALGLFACLMLFNESMTYPGFWALLPTVATAGVLAVPRRAHDWNSPATLLGLPPMGWIGDRSYSLYLWHWPVLVFAASRYPNASFATPIALGLAAALAWASYRWVEAPIRDGRLNLEPNWRGFAMAAAAVAVVLLGSNLLAKPYWHRSSATLALEHTLRLAAADRGRNVQQRCNRLFDQADQPLCAFGDVNASRTAVLFGDSHAAQWFEAVDKVAKANGWRLLAWTKSACPAAEISIWHKKLRARFVTCEQWRQNVLARLTGAERPQKVFIASFVETTGSVWDVSTGTILARPEGERVWRDGFASAIRRLQAAGVEPIVIADTPQANAQFVDCMVLGGGSSCDRPRDQAVPASRPDVDAATMTSAAVIDLTDRICGRDICSVQHDGMIVYRDRHHLTARFAASLADAFEPFLPAAVAGDQELVTSSTSSLRTN